MDSSEQERSSTPPPPPTAPLFQPGFEIAQKLLLGRLGTGPGEEKGKE